jgi:hypothetical protein
VIFGLTSICISLLFARSSSHSHLVAALQPMRPFLLVYFCMFVLLGGLIGRFLLRRTAWRWIVLFAGPAAGLAFAQHAGLSGVVANRVPQGGQSTTAGCARSCGFKDNTPQTLDLRSTPTTFMPLEKTARDSAPSPSATRSPIAPRMEVLQPSFVSWRIAGGSNNCHYRPE